jgi:tellurite resistance protein
MNTEIKNMAAVLATTIWADGVYDEAEKVSVEEIAEAFEVETDELVSAVETELEAIKEMDEESVNEYLLEASSHVDEEDAEMMLQAALQIATVDGVLCEEEVENILSIATALGVNEARAVLMLVDLVKEEPELKVDFK